MKNRRSRRTTSHRRTEGKKQSQVKKKRTKKRQDFIEQSPDLVTQSGINIKKVQATIDSMGNLFWKPDAGDHEIRILPPSPCMEGDFALLQVLHYGFHDDDGKIRTVRCLRSLDENCPVCDFVDELTITGDPDDRKLANDMRSQRQLLSPILVRPSKRVKIFRMPAGVYKTASGFLSTSRIGDFTDPKTGQDLLLTRKGEGLRTRYTLSCIGQCPIGVKGWKRQMPDMEKFLSPILKAKTLSSMIKKTFYDR